MPEDLIQRYREAMLKSNGKPLLGQSRRRAVYKFFIDEGFPVTTARVARDWSQDDAEATLLYGRKGE